MSTATIFYIVGCFYLIELMIVRRGRDFGPPHRGHHVRGQLIKLEKGGQFFFFFLFIPVLDQRKAERHYLYLFSLSLSFGFFFFLK